MSCPCDLKIQEFCELHRACSDVREWAISECSTMHDLWEAAKPDWLLWVATRPGVLDDRALRLFACWCARQVWHLLADERSRRLVEVAEMFARGQSTHGELIAARSEAAKALDEANDSGCDAAMAAAGEAAWATAGEAAWAAWAAGEAAWAAAWAADHDAAGHGEWDASRSAQAEWLRQNASPCFLDQSSSFGL